MKTITQIHLVVTTERRDDESEEGHQLRVYRAVLDAANKALRQFEPTVGLGGEHAFGCAQIVPNN